MAYFAALTNNIVTNCIVANTLTDAEIATQQTCIEYTTENPAGIGWTYNPETGTFTPPVATDGN